MKPTDLGTAIGINLGIVVAGFSGGIVSTLFATNLTRAQAVGSIIASILTSAYATPAIVQYFNVSAAPYQFGTAFLIGLFTMSLVPAVKLVGNLYLKDKLQGLATKQGLTTNEALPPPGDKPL